MKTPLLHDLLGWFAEKNDDLLFCLAKAETKVLKSRISKDQVKRPIYISGLARSGTTILLELLSQNREVASYRYMDFPLVMLPYWWGKYLRMNAKTRHIAVERSHADGLMVTPESPEAMEEMLWMRFFEGSHNPAINNILNRQHRKSDFDAFYVNTICKLLLFRGAKRYLAKNNYNIARLDYLANLFPDARFVIPIRDPVWHIASLIKQHDLLCREEVRNKHILDYMRRSGHFEFGLDRRPLNLISNERTFEIQRLWQERSEVKGWAMYWRDIYMYLANLLNTNKALAESTLVVSYEALCMNPRDALVRIYSHVKIIPDEFMLEKQVQHLRPASYYSPKFSVSDLAIIHAETADVYREMLRFAAGVYKK